MAKSTTLLTITEERILNKIYYIRGYKVMLDEGLAELYQVPTGRLNEQVKRNIGRFPEDFMFQLTEEEFKNLKSQFATSSWEVGESSQMLLQSMAYSCYPAY